MIWLSFAGHYCNTGIIPLLRRGCTKVVAVDSSDTRDLSDIPIMISNAERDQGAQIFVGRNEFGVKTISHLLQDFLLPRWMMLLITIGMSDRIPCVLVACGLGICCLLCAVWRYKKDVWLQ